LLKTHELTVPFIVHSFGVLESGSFMLSIPSPMHFLN